MDNKRSLQLITLQITLLITQLPKASSSPTPTSTFNILNFGAKANGVADASGALLKAWKAACDAVGAATIEVPKGGFLTRPLVFKGKGCKNSAITISMKGFLVAPADQRILGGVENWVSFKGVSGVAIVGDGGLDARGMSWWSCKDSNGKNCPQEGATSLRFIQSSNILIDGLLSLNSQKFHISVNGCQNVRIQGVKISASGSSPNTDGIHVQSSMHVAILNSTIKTGDDCISVGPDTKNLWVQDISCGPGHGISIGSLGRSEDEVGVQNVTVKTVVFTGTTNGLRIKSWARPINSFVQDVLFEDIVMENVENPIIIDQYYCPDNKDCPNRESGVQISNVTYKGIRGTSATKYAVTFHCSSSNPCKGITLQDVDLTPTSAQSTCKNAVGVIKGRIQPQSCLVVV
ncbi:hypothetical protein V2J09_023689 [Rumex salicifolius]